MSPIMTVLLLTSDHVGWAEIRATLASMSEVHVAGESCTIGRLRELVNTDPPDVIIAETMIEGRPSVSQLVNLRLHHCRHTKFILLGASYTPKQTRRFAVSFPSYAFVLYPARWKNSTRDN